MNKQLTLKGIGMPVVDADGRGKAIGIYADRVTLEGFAITSSWYDGIYVNSHNNNITGNTVSNNNDTGIFLYNSSNNTIYNNYFNNTKNAYDNGNNIWNIAKTLGTNIIGGPYLGGNYWSDYNGTDLDGDELGDTLLPYNSSGGIENGGDYHPLIEIKIKGYKFNDSNGDGVWDRVNESGLANWTIRLEGTAEDGSTISLITTTDANGSYRFNDVPRGTYTLSEILKAGWNQTWPPAPGTYIINITDDDVKHKNFGNRRFHYDGNIIVGAPREDVRGSKDQGRVYRFYGLTGEMRHTIDCPGPQPDALFGYSVCVIGSFMGVNLFRPPR